MPPNDRPFPEDPDEDNVQDWDGDEVTWEDDEDEEDVVEDEDDPA